MDYPNIHKAHFLDRPNRFVAHAMLNGEKVTVHVKNTGRCRELLTPNAEIYLVRSENPNRKTPFDLVAVQKGSFLINMDSQAPNRVFEEWVKSGGFFPNITKIKAEYTHGDSRFDFYLEQGDRKILVEVKGVTLEEAGVVYFPDAPTERGIKHIEGLIAAQKEGFECWLCFVVQLAPVVRFEPNDRTHPAFGAALRRAKEAGVHILAVDCAVAPQSLRIRSAVPVCLGGELDENE